MSDRDCPCGQGHYVQCCQPLHLGHTSAQTATQLMRSRYSAFAMQQINYIVKTTALGQQHALNVAELTTWSQSNQWLRLEVLNANEKLDKTHALVEFNAYYHDGTSFHLHHEISHFVKHENLWYFLDPTIAMPLTMKQPCVCGSGKKIKQCCVQFLSFTTNLT